MTSFANRNFAIFAPFSVLELTRYIVLNKSCLVLSLPLLVVPLRLMLSPKCFLISIIDLCSSA